MSSGSNVNGVTVLLVASHRLLPVRRSSANVLAIEILQEEQNSCTGISDTLHEYLLFECVVVRRSHFWPCSHVLVDLVGFSLTPFGKYFDFDRWEWSSKGLERTKLCKPGDVSTGASSQKSCEALACLGRNLTMGLLTLCCTLYCRYRGMHEHRHVCGDGNQASFGVYCVRGLGWLRQCAPEWKILR
jgi:hypothetical protein